MHSQASRRIRVDLNQRLGRCITHVGILIVQQLSHRLNCFLRFAPNSSDECGCFAPHIGLRVLEGLDQHRDR